MDYLCGPVLTIMNSPESTDFMQLTVDRTLSKPVYAQIADGIITAIRRGALRQGMALPGTRQLSSQLQVNRNTVVRAFEILSAEGWVSSTERHVTVVAESNNQSLGKGLQFGIAA